MNWNDVPLDLDNNSGIPIFRQISSWILKIIENGTLRPGDKLPAEREIAEKLGIARGTVKNALKKLEKDKIIETIQGSGSYIRKGYGNFEYRQKKEAIKIIATTIQKLQNMDLSEKEIASLFDLCLSSKDASRPLNIAIIDNNLEAMLDLKNQLSYLSQASLSILILQSITTSPEPEHLLENFDLIITSSSHYAKIIKLLPDFRDKIIEAVISPSRQTMIEIASLNRDARIGIVCRTNVFLSRIKETLAAFRFKEENVSSFFEVEYTPTTYFPGGIDALISFNDAHIFTSEEFYNRNEEFNAKGGKLIKFESHIEQGSVIYIEDKINSLLKILN